MKKSVILMGLTILLATSCKKKEETVTTPAKSRMELLTAHYWKLVSLTVDPPLPNGATDMYAQMNPCDKDDIVKYNTDGTTTNDEGATKCDPSDPQTSQGVWSFNSSQNVITEDGETENVLSLTESELKMNYITQINTVNYTLTATFVKN